MAMPRYVVLQSVYRGKNVIYYSDEEGDGQYRGFLHCAGEEVVSPLAKLEIERAKTAKGYVHIRCCYNNKYWCRSTKDDIWIAARGNEQEEDQTQWNCTLFKPMMITDNDNDHFEKLRLIHAQTGWYVNLSLGLERPIHPLYARNFNKFDEFSRDIYKVVDWESLLILPKFVAFKGYNGHYLTSSRYSGHPYLRFSSDDDSASSVMNEVFSNSDGSVCIKNRDFDRFWRNDGNWISVDADENKAKDSKSCWFWPFKISNNVVAFRSLSNNHFCASLTLDGKTDTLNACDSTASKQTRMEVKELVLSRSIYNLDFRVDDSRIYSERIQNMSSALVKNTSSEPNTISVKFTYTETTTTEWKASVSLKLGVETSIKAGVPLIVEGEVKINAEVETGYEWGKTETKTSQVETVYTVTVKPKTQLTAYLIATVGVCDVPFSYTQRDTLIDGTSRVQEMNDGVFTGVNCYKFQCETRNEVPLPDATPVEAVGALVHDAVDLVKSPFGLLKNSQSKGKPKKKP